MKILFADTAHAALKKGLQAAGFMCSDLDSDYAGPIAEALKGYDGVVIRSRFKFDRELLEQLSGLKFIARVGAGMENIDVTFAESQGIVCLHAPEGNRNAVAEHALGMLLAMLNHLCRANREVREGKWIREGNRGEELEGKTVGIIGFGNTGSSFARKLKGFDVKILAHDPYVKQVDNADVELVDMSRIFAEADVVSLHVPLTPETHSLVNSKWLSSFHKPFRLINTARGKCLVTQDLIASIESGQVISAALDVLEFESLSFEHFELHQDLLEKLKNEERLLLSPHIAGWTIQSNIKMAEILVQKIVSRFGSNN
ncbi:MAG: hydroxyacid dehydrogenase [Bacteroidetes bacterium]|nr:hydroxyacid dehydrogenase [Bacteroidota bacterium]